MLVPEFFPSSATFPWCKGVCFAWQNSFLALTQALPYQLLGFRRNQSGSKGCRRVLWGRLEIPGVVLGENCGAVVMNGDSGRERSGGAFLRSIVDIITLESNLAIGKVKKWAHPLIFGIYPREFLTHVHLEVCPRTFTEALFVITKIGPAVNARQ